jgi:hypothetical protein
MVRELLDERPEARGRKLLEVPGYTFHVLVTTRSHDPVATWRFYNSRAASENRKGARRQWETQQIVILLARLAHHLLVSAKRWLSREPPTRCRLRGYGLVRLLQEVGTVPSVLRWQHGWLVSIQFNPLHPLAHAL